MSKNGISAELGGEAKQQLALENACVGGGLICASVAASVGPQAGIKLQVSWTGLQISVKVGLVGFGAGGQIHPEVITEKYAPHQSYLNRVMTDPTGSFSRRFGW